MLFSALAFFTNIMFLGFKHADRWWFQFLTDVILVIYCHCCIFFSSYDYTTYVYWLLNDRDLGCFQGFLFVCLFVYYYTYYYQEPYGRDTERHNPDPLPKRGSLAHLLRELPLHNLHSGFTFRKSHQLHSRLSSLPGTTHNQWLDECINTWSTVEATQLRRSPWPQGCQAPITAWDLHFPTPAPSARLSFSSLDPNGMLSQPARWTLPTFTD